MVHHLRHIFGVGFPPQMLLRNASDVALPARVGCLMLLRWGWPVRMPTYETRRSLHSRAIPDARVAVIIHPIGPNKTYVPFVPEGSFLQEPLRLALRSTVRLGWISGSPPAPPMHCAPAAALRGFTAPINRADLHEAPPMRFSARLRIALAIAWLVSACGLPSKRAIVSNSVQTSSREAKSETTASASSSCSK